MNSNFVSLDAPVTPDEYHCCYFMGARKYFPASHSESIVIPDINLITTTEQHISPGDMLHIGVDVRSSPRDSSDWIGLYKGFFLFFKKKKKKK